MNCLFVQFQSCLLLFRQGLFHCFLRRLGAGVSRLHELLDPEHRVSHGVSQLGQLRFHLQILGVLRTVPLLERGKFGFQFCDVELQAKHGRIVGDCAEREQRHGIGSQFLELQVIRLLFDQGIFPFIDLGAQFLEFGHDDILSVFEGNGL